MTSHEYAGELLKIVNYLTDGRPEFEVDFPPTVRFHFWSEKEKFVAAVKALGSGTKEVSGSDFYFRVKGASIAVQANRDSVCKKIQEAKWECEPLFTPEEVQAMIPTPSNVLETEDIPF